MTCIIDFPWLKAVEKCLRIDLKESYTGSYFTGFSQVKYESFSFLSNKSRVFYCNIVLARVNSNSCFQRGVHLFCELRAIRVDWQEKRYLVEILFDYLVIDYSLSRAYETWRITPLTITLLSFSSQHPATDDPNTFIRLANKQEATRHLSLRKCTIYSFSNVTYLRDYESTWFSSHRIN